MHINNIIVTKRCILSAIAKVIIIVGADEEGPVSWTPIHPAIPIAEAIENINIKNDVTWSDFDTVELLWRLTFYALQVVQLPVLSPQIANVRLNSHLPAGDALG